VHQQPWRNADSGRAQWAACVVWLTPRVGFEMDCGWLLAGALWQPLAAGCNQAQGGLQRLGMLWLMCPPGLTALVRRKQASPGFIEAL
jgi:hypothetical protein